ncbi:MAG TPA: hypothetical protein VFC61_04960 [Blastocatellia bacterium]|nr:hypothetical protein [Blastocatellia bacterium]
MNEEEAFRHRERWLEEEYFRKKQEELIERLHRQKAQEQQMRALGAELRISDPLVLEALIDLGYTSDVARLAYIAPMLQVAWSDGGVSAEERELIIARVRVAGIEEGSLADRQLQAWLAEPPSERFLKVTLTALRAIFLTLPPAEGERFRARLIDNCTAVAEASRGPLGLGRRVSGAEHDALDRIAAELAPG